MDTKNRIRNSISFSILFCLPLMFACGDSQPGAPYGLLCELLRRPDAAIITDNEPEFSWIVNDTRQGAVQTAYQIIVASSQQNIDADRGDVWDSGKVTSGLSCNVSFNGTQLKPNSSYWWKIKTWDNTDQASPYSQAQMFRTGNFNDPDRSWPAQSKWIRVEDNKWLLENRQRADYHEIEPIDFRNLAQGHYFVDFGKAAFATLRLRLTAETAGDSVIVYLGERKTDDFLVHKNPGVSNIGFKKVNLVLQKGQHEYTIELPRHRSHYPNSQVLADHMPEVAPFRYAEIIDTPSELSPNDIRQIALFYYFDDEESYFSSSNASLNQVWELCKYTMKATPFLALYADGNRERMPYEADAYIQQLGHYCADREFSVARYTNQFLIFNPAWPTEWHLHTVLMAWADFMNTGDKENIERFYEEFKAKTLIALAREDGLISTRTGLVTPEFLKTIHYYGENTGPELRDIVDWPPGTEPGKKQARNASPYPGGSRDNYVFTDYNTVVNAFHYRSVQMISEMANVLGKSTEHELWAARAQLIQESFNRAFLDSERGIYTDGISTDHAALHANMMPLAFGLVPEQHIDSVTEYVKSKGMACSVYGAQYLMESLYESEQAQHALDLLTSDSKRSWMNMIRVGSTMATEAWDEYFKPNLTWNHAWGAAPANIIPRKLFGIEPLQPAFRQIRIKPQPGDLTDMEIKMPTIRGSVYGKWQLRENHFTLEVIVPANSTAQIWLPTNAADACSVNDANLTESGEIENIERKDKYTVCETSAGRYIFRAPYHP